VYLLGATNEDGLRLNASYFLQWSVIQYAKSQGCNRYDLGGIDPVGNPDVYRFKQRMGGEDVSSAGPYEAMPVISGKIVHFAEACHKTWTQARARYKA
jgi:lipid II:glycine glycyltransferase (peptidoglycan interpeptide bridge formation enzyme)